MSSKVIGMVLIFSAFFAAGSYIKSFYKRRETELKSLLIFVGVIKTKLTYNPVSLSELLSTTAQSLSDDNLSLYFSNVAHKIDIENKPLNVVWQEEYNNFEYSVFTNKSDKNFLEKLFSALCEASRETIINRLMMLEEDIKISLDESSKSVIEKGEVYSKVVKLAGIVLVVIII